VSPARVVEHTIEKGIAPKSAVAIVFSGPFVYDEAHILALRTMSLLLQSRLLGTIRQELGGTYSITVTPRANRFPQPEYTVRIDWTCDPARTAALVRRVFEEIAYVKATTLSGGQVDAIHESLLREFERNSQDNGYRLGQVSRIYGAGHAAEVAAVVHLPDLIAGLSGDAIQRAAQTYLNAERYVMVTLMPEAKELPGFESNP